MTDMNLSVGIASAPQGGVAPPASPNLFLWTEAMAQAVWAKTNCVVFEEVVGTADEIASTAPLAVLAQVTTTAATVGADATSVKSLTPGLVRYELTGTFDGLPYTLSGKLMDTGVAAIPAVVMRIARVGGFLAGSFEDPVGDGDYVIGEVQLEQAASATAYVARAGS